MHEVDLLRFTKIFKHQGSLQLLPICFPKHLVSISALSLLCKATGEPQHEKSSPQGYEDTIVIADFTTFASRDNATLSLLFLCKVELLLFVLSLFFQASKDIPPYRRMTIFVE